MTSTTHTAAKKFVSIIWGYNTNMHTFAAEENYHLHILKVAKELGFKPYIILHGDRSSIQQDPHLDSDTEIISYKNIFQYIYLVVKFSLSGSLFYVNSLEWQSFVVPFLARKTIFMAHTQPERQSPLKQKIQNFVYIFFTAIRLNNETEKDFLIKEGTDQRKLHVIPLVVSQNIFRLTDTQENRKDLVYFGNVTPKKNLSTILKAFKLVQTHHPEIKLHIIGNIYDSNFMATEGVIVHGHMPQDKNLVALLNKTRVSVNSSLDEGQCVAVYDTSLCGNALCLPNIMSFRGVFKNKALFHDIYDHKKLAENILCYLADTDILIKHRDACITMIQKDYSIHTIEEKLKELLSKTY